VTDALEDSVPVEDSDPGTVAATVPASVPDAVSESLTGDTIDTCASVPDPESLPDKVTAVLEASVPAPESEPGTVALTVPVSVPVLVSEPGTVAWTSLVSVPVPESESVRVVMAAANARQPRRTLPVPLTSTPPRRGSRHATGAACAAVA
jgi:hypothetical protein